MTKVNGMLMVEVSPTAEFDAWIESFLKSMGMPVTDNTPVESDNVELDWLFLIPSQDSPEACIQFIKDRYQEIFKSILMTWTIDRSLWPKDMSYEQFEKYFMYVFHSSIYDMSK